MLGTKAASVKLAAGALEPPRICSERLEPAHAPRDDKTR